MIFHSPQKMGEIPPHFWGGKDGGRPLKRILQLVPTTSSGSCQEYFGTMAGPRISGMFLQEYHKWYHGQHSLLHSTIPEMGGFGHPKKLQDTKPSLFEHHNTVEYNNIVE